MSRSSRLKAARKTQKKCESAVSYQKTDSQSNKFAPVDPKYRKVAADVAKNPSKYRGQVVALIDLPEEGGRLEDAFEIESLEDYTPRDFDDGFIMIRDPATEKLYVILVERNSTESQAKDGKGLQSMIAQGMKYAMQINAQVVAIAIDVDGGDEADRPAISEAMKWIHNGWAHALIAPAISRLDRREAAFGARMEELDDCESWLYFAVNYGDKRLDYCVWRDSSTRSKAVREVRKGEDYLRQGRAGVRETYRWKLEQGWMVSGKRPNFCMYNIVPLNSKKPRSEQLIELVSDARESYEDIWRRIVDGANRKDAKALGSIVADYSIRRGYDIQIKDLVWEIQIGWISGLNRVSPNGKLDLEVEVPGLVLENDDTRFNLLNASLDELLSLNTRNKSNEPRVNSIDEEEKERLRQVQLDRGARIRLGLNCYCNGTGTPMKPVGKAESYGLNVPRDWVICPVCSEGGSGATGKARLPRLKDIRRSVKLPGDPCRKCGSFVGLFESTKVQVDSLAWQVYSCKSCAIPAASLGPVVSTLEDFPKPAKKCRQKLESRSLPEF